MGADVTGPSIISRAAWGAQPWRPKVEMYRKTLAEQSAVFVHYHGGAPKHPSGAEMAREIEAIHLANGWAGVGYSFMVGQDGQAFEGRGWDLVTAACPGWNRQAWHVYVAVGGSQVPTAAALHTVRALYDEACRRRGRQLTQTWHGAHYATACPGPVLIPWVRGGMKDPRPASSSPARPTSPPNGDDMPTAREVADTILDTPMPGNPPILGSDGHPLTFRWAMRRMYDATVTAAEHQAEAAQPKVAGTAGQLAGDDKVS
jgi:hypothetical protein